MPYRTLLVILVILLLPLSIVSAMSATPSQPLSSNQEETAPHLKIGEVQGSVTGNPQTFRSPYRNEQVRVSGVITNLIMLNTDSRVVNGLFLQETPENSDGDPTTSDGIQVIIGASSTIGDYTPVVGDSITIEGKVEEYYENTRLTRLTFISLDGHIDDLEAAIPIIEINPNSGTIDEVSLRYEQLEGMRVMVPSGAMVVSATHIFTSTNDTEIYVIRHDHPVAQREDVYSRRVHRDPHPLDDGLPGENPYRISVEANILKAYAGDYEMNLPAISAYSVFSEPLVGNLVYAYARYTLQIETLPPYAVAAEPSDNNPVTAPDRDTQFSIATFNVENLYDFYNDPFDSQDSPDDPRLNYVPDSLEDYQRHVEKIALAILEDLHAPDVIGFQEVEDQDVCSDGGQLYGTCGETDHADGLPDVLADVAQAIMSMTDGTIEYSAAIDRDSADNRGISQAYLYRTDRVELVPADANDPIFGARPDDPDAQYYEFNQEVSNPKAFNQRFGPGTPVFERPPVIALFRIYRLGIGTENYVDVYVSNNHYKSNPDEFKQLREHSSLYNVSLAEAAGTDAYFVVLGDLNSFYESEELAALEPTFDSLWDEIPVESRYTYTYSGQSQTLDYIYATPNLVEYLAAVRVAHINSDYGYSLKLDSSTSHHSTDHDPVVATFNFPE